MTNEKSVEICKRICSGGGCSRSCGDYPDSGGELGFYRKCEYSVHRVIMINYIIKRICVGGTCKQRKMDN